MNRNLSSIALGIALAYATVPAWAATSASINQNGADNDGYIEQQNTSGTASATITQTGDGNKAGAAPFPGPAGTVDVPNGGVMQLNSSGVTASVTQDGGERAFVWQENLTLGTANSSATINQSGVPGNENNLAFISQVDGSDYAATILQSGDSNQSLVYQHGTSSNLVASITQSGDNNASGAYGTIVNYGFNPAGVGAAIDQTGLDQYAVIDQSGDNNAARIGQGGDNHDAWVYQLGNNNVADVTQSASTNYAYVYQAGNDSLATVAQTGSNNFGYVTQTAGSAFNWANINQSSSGNYAAITQTGNGILGSENTAFIAQAGAGGFTATINQAGGAGNHAGINQF